MINKETVKSKNKCKPCNDIDLIGEEIKHPEYFKPKKEQVSIRLNKCLLDHFRAMGKGWQTKINDFLMDAVRNGQI